ncbi:hypothetical protein SBV1_340012 [Verrucomicrobia bacterium]|nr:hypothetical protein SBV1_340012 [Verrucomicrobiota bacterium]
MRRAVGPEKLLRGRRGGDLRVDGLRFGRGGTPLTGLQRFVGLLNLGLRWSASLQPRLSHCGLSALGGALRAAAA